jgi:hypothetical protein
MAKTKHVIKVQSEKRNVEAPPAPQKSAEKITCVLPLSCCPSCGSAKREDYHNVRRLPFGGITPDGRAYTHVIWRRTRCLDCGQARDDKSFE